MRRSSGCGGTEKTGALGARTEDAHEDQTRFIERTVTDSIQLGDPVVAVFVCGLGTPKDRRSARIEVISC